MEQIIDANNNAIQFFYDCGTPCTRIQDNSLMGKPEWLVDPQRWNRYAYVRNNPLKYIDPNGEDLTIYWSLGNDLSEDDLEWFKKNKQAILDTIRAKYEKAGVKNVNIRELSTLRKEQIAELDKKSPFGVNRLLIAGREYPGIKPEAPLGTLGYTHPDSKAISAIFLDAFPKRPPAGCDAVCIGGNVGAHEIGHGLGMDHGTTLEILQETWRVLRGGSPDLMMGNQGVPTQPLEFNTARDKTKRAIEQLNRIGDMTPKKP